MIIPILSLPIVCSDLKVLMPQNFLIFQIRSERQFPATVLLFRVSCTEEKRNPINTICPRACRLPITDISQKKIWWVLDWTRFSLAPTCHTVMGNTSIVSMNIINWDWFWDMVAILFGRLVCVTIWKSARVGCSNWRVATSAVGSIRNPAELRELLYLCQNIYNYVK